MSVRISGSNKRLSLSLPAEGQGWKRHGDEMIPADLGAGSEGGGFTGGTVPEDTTFTGNVTVHNAFTAEGAPVSLNGLLTIGLDGKVSLGSSGGDIEISGAGDVKLAQFGKCGFFGSVGQVQPLFATGAAHTVDELIALLQGFGLIRQS